MSTHFSLTKIRYQTDFTKKKHPSCQLNASSNYTKLTFTCKQQNNFTRRIKEKLKIVTAKLYVAHKLCQLHSITNVVLLSWYIIFQKNFQKLCGWPNIVCILYQYDTAMLHLLKCICRQSDNLFYCKRLAIFGLKMHFFGFKLYPFHATTSFKKLMFRGVKTSQYQS